MNVYRVQFARPAVTWLVLLAACVSLIGAPLASAQAPAASGNAAQAPTPQQLEKLVGPIALYPDDLVSIILPASTNPLQLVQADRFLEKRKKDPKLAIDDKWDDSVKSLVNYPEVIKQMSTELDWTTDLGEAVVADQGAVLNAVQAFRRKAQSAGNLKTDAKQVVVVEKEVVKIVPADPQVIYVPQYNPSTVVVVSATPVYGYYPAAYPVYYYPYPPGAALATGLVWGAAIGAAWNGGHYAAHWGGNNDITINRNTNINTGNINTGNINRPQNQPAQTWKSDKKPGQVSSGAGRATTTGTRVGDARPTSAGAGGATARPTSAGAGGATARSSMQSTGGMQATSTRGGSGDAFGGYGSGSSARADSARGTSSRSSMSSASARSTSASAGARSGGGGGGGRRR